MHPGREKKNRSLEPDRASLELAGEASSEVRDRLWHRSVRLRTVIRSTDRRWLKRRLYLLRHFDRATVRRIRSLSRRPIVIGGCGRSGTTLLLSLLSCHPRILCIPVETRALCPTGYSDQRNPDAEFELEWLYDQLAATDVSRTAARWCEKTPRNVLFIERILKYLGKGTRFLNIVRDGRDVITSVHPRDPSRYWVEAERWIEDVAAGARHDADPRVLTVRYEDLIRDLEAVMRGVCEFLNEEFHSNLLEYPESATVRSNVAWFGAATKVHAKSVRRWNQDRHRERVEELMRDPRAIDQLARYNYLDECPT